MATTQGQHKFQCAPHLVSAGPGPSKPLVYALVLTVWPSWPPPVSLLHLLLELEVKVFALHSPSTNKYISQGGGKPCNLNSKDQSKNRLDIEQEPVLPSPPQKQVPLLTNSGLSSLPEKDAPMLVLKTAGCYLEEPGMEETEKEERPAPAT